MSSTSDPFRDYFDSDTPRQELDSPFLNEEYLIEETEVASAWENRLTGFQLESPFLEAFEEGWRAIDESEVEELYSEANYPESNEFDYGEVSDKPTADAFVADNDGKRHFETFPQLGNLIVKKVTILTPSNFENLMNLMLASSQKNFVIDAHGEPKGLFMPLTKGTKIAATKHSLFILRGIEHIRFLIRTAKESETIWGRASGTDVDRWRKILEVLHSKIWQQMVGAGWPTIIPQVTSVDEAKKIVQSRINSLVDSLFPGKVTNKQDQVDRLIKKMMRLQAKGIREIQFRACNIGKDSNTLYEFQKFFGTDHLCAPDVRSGMGSANPSIDRQAVNRLGQDNRTQVFNMPSGRFSIRIIITGVTFTVNCAAETQAAVREWVAGHMMTSSTYRSGVFPIHFLQTQPLAFPLDSDYAAHIKCRSSFWEGVVRGSEKHRLEVQAEEEGNRALAEPEFEEFEEFFDESDEEEFEEEEKIADYPTHEVEDLETEVFNEFLDELDEEEFDELDESKYEFASESPESSFKTSGNHTVIQQHQVPQKGASQVQDKLGQKIVALLWEPIPKTDSQRMADRLRRLEVLLDDVSDFNAGALLARLEPGGDLYSDFEYRLSTRTRQRLREKLKMRTIHKCSVFLPANPSQNYEDYVAAPTTGRITLMLNGRSSGGSGPHSDQTEAFDSMQKAVEPLKAKDSVYLTAWHFDPTVPLTAPSPSGMKTWGDLLQRKAKEGVKIRIIMTDFDPIAKFLHAKLYNDFLPALNKLIGQLSPSVRDNLKYIVSRHPATQFTKHVATHHQKFMVVKNGGATTAFCGGLDIAYMRTPFYWNSPNYQWLWHDIHSKLEGLIAHNLEQEFVLRWNREKNSSVVPSLKDWQAFEELVQSPAGPVDRKANNNTQKLQMLRTVSVQGIGKNIQRTTRDDILQGYLRLISCATRFVFMENQYFRELKIADAIVKQGKAQQELIVIIVVPAQLDDPDDPIKRHGNFLQQEFFTRLFAGLGPNRLRIYTMFRRIIHSKLILVDDHALSMGSANANPRGFFLDTELNVMLDDAETVKSSRHHLWSHDLGVPQNTVAGWAVSDFMTQWDAVAKANQGLTKTPDEMTGEAVIPFDPRLEKGQKQSLIHDVLTEVNNQEIDDGQRF